MECANHDFIIISNWIRFYLKINPNRIIAYSTSINIDLGVDGDDGVDLIKDFGKEFSIDISSFNHDEYFGPELGFFSFFKVFKKPNLYI